MAPTVNYARQKVVRRTTRSRRAATPTEPLPWTVGDDDDLRPVEKSRKKYRRQELVPVVPSEPVGVVPEPERLVALPEVPDETAGSSSESTQNDSFSSESSASESDGELEGPNSDGSDRSAQPAPISATPSQPFTTVPADELPYEKLPDFALVSSVTEDPPSPTSTSSILFSTVSRSGEQDSVGSVTATSSSTETASSSVIRIHEHPHGLSKDAIHGLIAFGALGGLMGILAMAWFFWRRMKKKNRPLSLTEKPRSFDSPKPPRHVQLLAKVPFLKSRFANRSWFNIDDPYHNDNNSHENVYQEKSWTQTTSAAPRLDSQFFSPNQVMGIAVRVQGGDHAPNETVSSHQANDSFSSSMQQQRSSSQRSKIHPFPVNPIRRLSEMSSLSSGFGDDMAPPNGESTLERNMPQAPPSAYGGSRRDTVYTEASEDLPPRHRNVNSWVKQQTSRVKRSQARAEEEDAPPVPQMPAEQDFRLMLPDGEIPRRVEGSETDSPGVAR